MRFYRNRGHASPAILWNPITNSPWYEFANGVYDAEEPEVIAKLREMGFSETPIDPKMQAALAITADLTMPQPKPPPRYQDVPAVEPKPKEAPAPKVETVAIPPKHTEKITGELGTQIKAKPIAAPRKATPPKR